MNEQIEHQVYVMLAQARSRPERLEALQHWVTNNPETEDPQVNALVERTLSEGFLVTQAEEVLLVTAFLETHGR